ncbi:MULTISPECIES: hypothetical protein [unclassified Bartonella]|uniref:hypothetical protein n=2 Tax=Bartonella TaxID=773 RepID=UPI0035CF9FAE
MDLYIVRVFGHFGLLGAWNVVRGLGGSVFVNGGRRLEEEGCSVVKCVMGEKKGEWRMKRVRMDKRRVWVRRVLQRDA